MIEFSLLGSLEVVKDDQPVALGSPKQRALLAALLVHRRQHVSSDRLIDELWGERTPPTARKILQGYVSNLRKVLGEGVVLSRGHGYLLQVDPAQTDVDRFESLVAKGHGALADGDSGTAAEALREALSLWRGPALADFAYEPFAQSEISRLEEARLAVLEDRIEAELALGMHAQLVGELEALVHEHPLRERLIGELMLALYRSGRQADALETYRRARTRLVEELGLEPGRELKGIENQILAQDPALDAPVRRKSVEPARARKRGGRLIAAGGAVLLAAVIAVLITLTGSGGSSVRVAPNSIAAIDLTSDHVVAAAPVGARPEAIAFGSGSLWVTNLDDQTISRVDPRTLQTSPAIRVGAPPTGIASAGTGVWVATSGPTSNFVLVSHIDPQFDVIDRSTRVQDVVPGSPAAIAAGGSRLWVAPSSGELTALDPSTGHITKQFDPNSAPQGVGIGAGDVWLTDNEADNVIRVDPAGVVRPLPVGHGPNGIAVGAGGVWVADTGDNTVLEIDPGTGAVTATIRVGQAPTGIALGGGSVWVANSGDGTVTRIDPRSGKAIATISIGGSPQEITIAAGRAWVTVDGQTIPPSSAAASKGTVRIDTDHDFGPLDPALVDDPIAAQIFYASCAQLLTYPDKAGAPGSQLVPEAAQALPARSADGKSYTFTIRRGFRFWPTNEPVTAQTFKHSIERSLDPRMRSPVGPDFADIVGASAYMAGKAPHISGVIARGKMLRIRLTAPAPDLLARVAMPAFCAVPLATPADPRGLRTLPSAGPYRIASYTPAQGAVLVRNPSYSGGRPRRAARIVVSIVASSRAAIAQVEAGTADYADNLGLDRAQIATLTNHYGPGSPAAKRGHQQLLVNSSPQLDFFVLNTHRPLFADTKLRQAVNYAISRAALAHLGDIFLPGPEHPTDHYLPQGMSGYRNVHIYPLTPDVAKAKQLASGRQGATVVLYTCDAFPCQDQAEIVKRDLAAIGLNVEIKVFPTGTYFTEIGKPGAPYDMAWQGWIPDYLDPNAMLGVLLEQGLVLPSFADPIWRARLAAASRIAGPKRYLEYARLDADLARDAAPFVAFGSLSNLAFFSARTGCEVYTPAYGMDLGALCIKHLHS